MINYLSETGEEEEEERSNSLDSMAESGEGIWNQAWKSRSEEGNINGDREREEVKWETEEDREIVRGGSHTATIKPFGEGHNFVR